MSNESRDRRVACEGQDNQQVSGQGLWSLRLLRPRAGPGRQGRLRRSGRRFRHALGGRRQGGQTTQRHRRRGQGGRPGHSGDRPGSGGRGDLLAYPRDPHEQEAPEGQARRPRGVQRRHQGRDPGGHAPSARDRRGAGRCLPGAPRARLSRWLHALASSVAQAPRRALRGTRPIRRLAHRLRPRARDRAVRRPRILVDRRPPPYRGEGALHRTARRRRRQEDQPPRHRLRRRSRSLQGCFGDGKIFRQVGRIEAGQAPPLSALHHLDPAAGGLAQARPRAGAHDADRPAPL